MLRAYKTELDVNNKQRTYLLQCAGTARFVFNWALRDRIERYEYDQSTNKFEQKRRFNALKKELYPWIYDVPYVIMQEEFDKCDDAYQNFFRKIKKGEKSVVGQFEIKLTAYQVVSQSQNLSMQLDKGRQSDKIGGWNLSTKFLKTSSMALLSQLSWQWVLLCGH